MPVNRSLMNSLKKQYGAKKGTEIYYKMEAEGKVPGKSKRKPRRNK